MATYVYTPTGLQNTATGEIEPWTRDAPPVLPRIDTSDDQEALVSMADGKTYTSKAKMRESYKASNNPQGVNFIEVGHETRAKPQVKPKPDRAAIKDSVDRAYSEMRTRGEIA